MKDFLLLLAVALSLSADAFAIAMCCGMGAADFKLKHALKLGVYFGAFQFAMPIAGFYLGKSVYSYVARVDHWIAFALLAFIGGKMIFEAFSIGKQECCECAEMLSTKRILVLSVAGSIDALIVGVTMAFTDDGILASAALIGIVCFAVSTLGGLLGKRLGLIFSKYASAAGGGVLILLGIKTLVEHL